jgi:hypothetical protein
MNKGYLIGLLLLMIISFCYGGEKIILQDGINFEKKLADNNVFLKSCSDFEIEPEKNLVYFLDKIYGQVFKVELSTGKLLKTIGTKGQGPKELMIPVSLRVRNDKIFVLDAGFNGIKIFNPEGNFINEFKLRSALMGKRNIDVNEKDEIFLGKIDYQTKTMVSVYSVKGKRIRSLIRYRGENRNNDMAKISRYQYLLKLDNKGNIYLLHYMLRKVGKYDKNGNFLWESDIENEILAQFPGNEFVKANGKTISTQWYVFNLDVIENNDIVVGHAGGGCLFGEDGKLKKLLLVKNEIDGKEYNVNLDLFKLRGNILMNILIDGKFIDYYKYKEVSR